MTDTILDGINTKLVNILQCYKKQLFPTNLQVNDYN